MKGFLKITFSVRTNYMKEEIIEQDEESSAFEESDEQPVRTTFGELVRSAKLPPVVWMVFLTTFLACVYSGESFFYFSLGGFAWLLSLVFSGIVLTLRIIKTSFPLFLWLPWILTVAGLGYISDFPNMQRSFMLLCPVFVGMAVSTSRITNEHLQSFILMMKIFSVVLLGVVLFLTGMLLTGILPSATGLAPQAITSLLLSTFFVALYSFGGSKNLGWYIVSGVVPIIALTRAAIAITGLSLPLSFSPLKLQTRVIMLVVVCVVGLIIFFTPRVQKKMFFTGEGDIEDIGGRTFATSGRQHMAEILVTEIAKKPYWGHGANASEQFISNYSRGQLTHPHNDWLRFLYDYGAIPTALFALTLFAQTRHTYKKAREAEGVTKILFYAGASSFLPFMLIMFTDNVVLYAAYFGNLQFTILGLAYAADKTARREAVYEEDELPRRTTRSRAYRETSEDVFEEQT